MKRIWTILLCAMLLVVGVLGVTMLSGTAVTAAEVDAGSVPAMTTAGTGSKITVSGSGEVKLVPDLAIVSVGVDTLHESLETAQKENANSMQNIIAFLKDYGIAEENIKTKNFNVYQRYDYTNGEKLMGYQVSNYVDFKTKDVDNIGMIVSKLMENGANRFSGITFTIEDYDSAYRLALSKALENAKSKLGALSEDSYSILEISEENSYNYVAREAFGYMYADKEASGFIKGEIVVKASVKVIFGI